MHSIAISTMVYVHVMAAAMAGTPVLGSITLFLALSAETVRRWKGAPLALEGVNRLSQAS